MKISACGGGPDSADPPPSPLSQVTLSGKITLFGTNIPVCALVLANGKSQFSCDGAGNFSLADVPVDARGLVTLYSWADGFIPFKAVFAPGQAAEIHDVAMRVRCN